MADLLVVDARNLLWRMGDAHKLLHAEQDDGTVVGTGGMYGFLGALVRLREQHPGAMLAIAWEGRGENFRKAIFPGYKERGDMNPALVEFVEDLRRQERLLKELLSKMGVRQWEGIECEGDDVIGVLAERGSSRGRDVVVYSGDGDVRQLVRARATLAADDGDAMCVGSVVVVAPGHGRGGEHVYDHAAVLERHKLRPEQIPHLKALMGDPGDCIPGVDGVGEVTATKLVQRYESLDGVIVASSCEDHAVGWPVPERHRAKIAEQADLARTCLRLATIDVRARVVPIRREPDARAAMAALLRYKFRSLMTAASTASLLADAGGAA